MFHRPLKGLVIVSEITFIQFVYIFHTIIKASQSDSFLCEKLTSLYLQGQNYHVTLKGALSGLRQFLETESRLKVLENAFYFNLKALFVLKIFKFLS